MYLKIISEDSSGDQKSLCSRSIHFFVLAAGLIMFAYYTLPFNFNAEDAKFQKGSFSIEMKVSDNSYFERALIKFNKGRYTRAKEYLLKVDSWDENYDKARDLLNVIDGKIDTEGLSDTDIETDFFEYPAF